jgi:hypothetical protein
VVVKSYIFCPANPISPIPQGYQHLVFVTTTSEHLSLFPVDSTPDSTGLLLQLDRLHLGVHISDQDKFLAPLPGNLERRFKVKGKKTFLFVDIVV